MSFTSRSQPAMLLLRLICLPAAAFLILQLEQLAGADRAESEAAGTGTETASIAVTARAAGVRTRSQVQSHQQLATDIAVESKKKEASGSGIADLIKEVGAQINGALKRSADNATLQFEEYQKEVKALHEALGTFGNGTDQLKQDLTSEHAEKVASINKALIANMAPEPAPESDSLVEVGQGSGEQSFVDLGSTANTMGMPGMTPFDLGQGLGGLASLASDQVDMTIFRQPAFSGPPPTGFIPAAAEASGLDDDVQEALLGPANGI